MPLKNSFSPCKIAVPYIDQDGDGRKLSMHNRFVQQAKVCECEVVFIGDSIIEQLQFSTLWREKISALHCINFGIGGDKVENVLWRVQNGTLDFNTSIKAVVLFAGTNNCTDNPEDTVQGILGLIGEISEKLASVCIILPTLLPRGQFPNPYRKHNELVNDVLVKEFSNGDSNVCLVPIHENIVQSDGSISHHIMHDYLHLTDFGYTKIFEKVYEKLKNILEK